MSTTTNALNTSNKYIKYEITVEQGTPNVVNNTSPVTISVRFYRTNTGYETWGNGRVYVEVDGDIAYQTVTSSQKITHSGIVLYKSTLTNLKHEDDGTKTIKVMAWIDHEEVTSEPQGAYFVLNPIARASQPSCITWPEHTQNVGEFGDEISIHMNRKSDSFTHTVRYQFGSQSGTIATGVTNGTKWTIPLTLMNLIPNAIKGSGTIYVDTYNGSTKVGTKSCGFTATVPASVKPTCTVTVSDPTGYATTYGSYVKTLSKFQVAVTPTLAYQSGIKTYNTTANGGEYTTSTFTTGVLKSSGTLTVSTNIVDNRGRSASASKTITVLDYVAPTISKLTVGRCDADGTANEQGDHVQVTFSATVTALNNKNTAIYTLKYKKSAENEFTSITVNAIKNTYSVTNHSYIFEADTGSSYDVELAVVDNHGNASRSTSASTAFTLMHFGADGTSIGLLRVAEKPNAVDVGGDVYLNGHCLYGSHGMFDTRETNESPQWYMDNHGRGTVWEFKNLKSIGFTAPSVTFSPVQTIIPWEDSSGGLPSQITYEGRTRWLRTANSASQWGAWQTEALSAYPVGSIYIAYNHTNPSQLFGGTWVRMTDGFLWASRETDTIGQTGGEKTHTLTMNEMPSHSHKQAAALTSAGSVAASNTMRYSNDSTSYLGSLESGTTGGGQAHNNMPPYIQVSIWRRTA